MWMSFTLQPTIRSDLRQMLHLTARADTRWEAEPMTICTIRLQSIFSSSRHSAVTTICSSSTQHLWTRKRKIQTSVDSWISTILRRVSSSRRLRALTQLWHVSRQVLCHTDLFPRKHMRHLQLPWTICTENQIPVRVERTRIVSQSEKTERTAVQQSSRLLQDVLVSQADT